MLSVQHHRVHSGHEESADGYQEEWRGGRLNKDQVNLKPKIYKSQVGTVYDQNHNDNHRNSMAGQTILLELNPGDKVQVFKLCLILYSY